LSEFVHAIDVKYSTICDQWLVKFNLITCKVSVSNKLLTWLVYSKGFWKFLSSKVDCERVPTIISIVNFSDFDGVVSQEVVEDEGKFP
jgi:hypothetical protein